jgi:hypothetical protein
VKIVSIQGEQQEAKQETLWASNDQVDDFCRKVNPKYLPCRGRARHFFPQPVPSEALTFDRIDADGWWVREVDCLICGNAYQVQRWDVKHRSGKISRCDKLDAKTQYHNPDEYLMPVGTGRAKAKQVESAVASQALEGQSVAALRKDTKAREKAAQRKLAAVVTVADAETA